jgi:hypothetical protein
VAAAEFDTGGNEGQLKPAAALPPFAKAEQVDRLHSLQRGVSREPDLRGEILACGHAIVVRYGERALK